MGGGSSGYDTSYQEQQIQIAQQQLQLQRSQIAEPAKEANVEKEAAADTLRNQQLRHGLASSFSRSSIGKSSSGGSATSGSAGKLGS